MSYNEVKTEEVVVEPRSREEAMLKSCCYDTGNDELPTPRSREEILLCQLAKKLPGGGADGDGIGIEKTEINADGELIVTYTDGNSVNLGKVVGADGAQGPQGIQGETGAKGDKGDKGEKGEKGDAYTLTKADKQEIAQNATSVCVAKNQGASNVGKILVVGTDGNLTLMDMPEGGASGDVTGVFDESNNLLLSGNLPNGTYTLSYIDKDGNIVGDAGSLVVGAIPEPVEPVTENITLTDGIRIGSDGGDRTQAGYCATPYIDLTSIPKPCAINLTKAKWAFATSSETGMIMYYALKADGTKLAGGYTNDTIGSGHFNLVRNNGKNTDITVTVTSNEVAKIRFSGQWASADVRDDYGFADWDTNMHAEATLTYTPTA